MSRRDHGAPDRGRRQARRFSHAAAGSRAGYGVACALGIAGLLVSALLARLHARAHAGITSFCSLSETVNCDRVALSAYSVQLGLPVAVWGILGYGLVAATAVAGLARRRAGSTWPAGVLLVLSTVAVATSAGFALVSKFAIGAWCLLCAVSWAISLALLVTCWRAFRLGARDALRSAVAAATMRRGAGIGVALAAAIALTVVVYPRYWERQSAAATPTPVRPAESTAGEVLASSGTEPLVVVEYTDYQCPYCARMHEELRAVASRPDVRLVRRHFPLDGACNPAVGRGIHPVACSLARAAICGEAQGLRAPMDEALFANQRERLPVNDLAARAGLDLRRFEACLSSADTARRLADDIAAAVRSGVRATPSYVVGGTVHAGRFPVELLPRSSGAQVDAPARAEALRR